MNKNIFIILILAVAIAIGIYLFTTKKGKQRTEIAVTTQVAAGPSVTQEAISGTPLVTIDGRSVITLESLQEEKQKLFKASPEIEKFSAYMDIDRTLLRGLTSQVIMDKYIDNQGIKNSDEYQNDLQSGYKDVERMVNTKYFSQAFPSNVTDADVKKFYEENLAEFVLSRGGIKANEIAFDQEAQAKDFAEKVKAKKGDVQTAAKEANIATDKIKDLKLVHEQSIAIDQEIKDALATMQNVPDVAVVKTSDNKYAVVVGLAKEETKYRPLDEQIKAKLKKHIEKEKQTEAMEKAIDNLKQEYRVVVDEAPLGPEKSAGFPEMMPQELESEMMEQV